MYTYKTPNFVKKKILKPDKGYREITTHNVYQEKT